MELLLATLHYTALTIGVAVLIVCGVLFVSFLALRLIELMTGHEEQDQ